MQITFTTTVQTTPPEVLELDLSRDGIDVTVSSTANITSGTFVDGGALWVASTGTVSFATPTLNASFVGSGAEWMASVAMVEPEGYERQPFDSRGTIGPNLVYDASLGTAFPVEITPSADDPQVVVLYRGLDTPQSGGSGTGCEALVPVYVYHSEPSATALTPPPVKVPGGKPLYTTADIDYNAFTPVTMSGSAVEPDWTTIKGYHNRPYFQTSGYFFGAGGAASLIAVINPTYSQDTYPAYQALYTGNVLLGAVSDSADRNDLINRIVRDGVIVDTIVQYYRPKCWVPGAGFGQGAKALRWFAGLFLGDNAMMAKPSPIWNSYTGTYTEVFQEDGVFYLSKPSTEYATPRAIYGSPGNSSTWPSGPFAANHDTRDPNGEREPHWMVSAGGTAQAGGASTITVAADETTDTVLVDYVIWIDNGGAGEIRQIAGYDDGTKVVTVSPAWVSAPSNGTPYEIYHGGAYQALATHASISTAYAVALTGLADDFDTPQNAFWAYHSRWYSEGADKPEPRWIWGAQTSDLETYGDTESGLWSKLFASAAVAEFPAVSTTAIIDNEFTAVPQTVRSVLTTATTADVEITSRSATGTIHWVATRSPVKPTVAQIVAGNDYTGAAGLETGDTAISGAGDYLWEVVVDGTDRYVHMCIQVSSDYSAPETTRPLNSGQWGLGVSYTMNATDAADWVQFNTATVAYDAGNNRLQITQGEAWAGASGPLDVEFEHGIVYNVTVNATNASLTAVMEAFAGATLLEQGAGTYGTSSGAGNLDANQTGNITFSFTGRGEPLYLTVRHRGGGSEIGYVNSVTVTQA